MTLRIDLPHSRSRDLWLWLFGRRHRLRVVGQSMVPLLHPGDEVLIHPRAYQNRHPTVGEIVVAQHPDRPDLKLVKRITQILPDGRCVLQGENLAESTDSRTFGAIAPDLLLGKVISRFP